jgi:hypothetical protein
MSLLHVSLYSLYLFAFVKIILRADFFSFVNADKKHLLFFFLLKVLGGILFTLIYTYYYTDPAKADIYRYFNDSKIISEILFHHPLHWLKIMSGIGIDDKETFKYILPTQNFSHPSSDFVTNNTSIIRLNVLLNYFSLENIYINTLFFNFFCFAGLTALFKSLKSYFIHSKILYIPIYLLPSVVFWSSGLLKEALLLSLTGFAFFFLQKQHSVFKKVAGIICAIVILLIKPMVFASLIISTLFYQTVKIGSLKNKIHLLLLTIMWAGIIFVAFYKLPYISQTLMEKRNEFVLLAKQENAGSVFDLKVYDTNTTALILLLPQALLNALLQPFIWSDGNIFLKLFGIENLFFILLIFTLFIFLKRQPREKYALAIFLFMIAAFNYLIVGITTPIAGAVVHYRIFSELFLILSFMCVIDENRLINCLKNYCLHFFTIK